MSTQNLVQVVDRASTINWNELPSGPVNLGCLESPIVRTYLAASFSVLGSISLGTAIACCFVATPFNSVFVVSGLALLTLACGVAAVGIYCLRPSQAEQSMTLRQQARTALIEANNPSYGTLQTSYPREILSLEDINKGISRDAINLTFDAFLERHGEESLSILDDSNKAALLQKAIDYVSEKYILVYSSEPRKSLNEILSLPVCTIFGITAEHLKPAFVTASVKEQWRGPLHIDPLEQYEAFLKSNGGVGIAGIKLITDPEAKKWLAGRFIDCCIKHIRPQQEIEEALDAFGEETRATYKEAVIEHQVRGFIIGTRTSNDIGSMKRLLGDLTQNFGEQAVRDYLKKDQPKQGQIAAKFAQCNEDSLRTLTPIETSILGLDINTIIKKKQIDTKQEENILNQWEQAKVEIHKTYLAGLQNANEVLKIANDAQDTLLDKQEKLVRQVEDQQGKSAQKFDSVQAEAMKCTRDCDASMEEFDGQILGIEGEIEKVKELTKTQELLATLESVKMKRFAVRTQFDQLSKSLLIEINSAIVAVTAANKNHSQVCKKLQECIVATNHTKAELAKAHQDTLDALVKDKERQLFEAEANYKKAISALTAPWTTV